MTSEQSQSRRIERTTSQTAEVLSVIRACSWHDRSPYGHSGDWVAARLLDLPIRTLSHFGWYRRLLGRLFRPGQYNWAVARTRYVDAVFDKYAGGMKQVVIMGAGYDSRAIRFRDQLTGARVFEVDAPATQVDKRRGLALHKLPVPDNLVFVPVDFETQTAAERLAGIGFRSGMATLWLLEGLIMYLEPETVDATFRMIADSAGSGSVVVFDYVYADVIRGGTTRYGAAGVTEAAGKAGERWRFGIEEGQTAGFVARYGFGLTDEAAPAELERRYFTDASGRLHGRVNGTQAVLTARKP